MYPCRNFIVKKGNILQRRLTTSKRMSKGKMLLMLNRLQSAFFRSCYDSCGVRLRSKASTIHYGPLSQIMENIENSGMVATLASRGWTPGFAALNSLGLSQLIEFQTLGQAWTTTASLKKATLTEAALIAPFLDKTFKRLAAPENSETTEHWMSTLHFSDLLDDVYALSSQMDNQEFIGFEINFSIQETQEPCRLVLGFSIDSLVEEEPNEQIEKPQDRFNQQYLGLQVEFQAILHQFQLTVEDINTLAINDTIKLPSDVLNEVKLVSKFGGPPLSGQMGRTGGFRAVQVSVNQNKNPVKDTIKAPPKSSEQSVNTDQTFGQPNLAEIDRPDPSFKEVFATSS